MYHYYISYDKTIPVVLGHHVHFSLQNEEMLDVEPTASEQLDSGFKLSKPIPIDCHTEYYIFKEIRAKEFSYLD